MPVCSADSALQAVGLSRIIPRFPGLPGGGCSKACLFPVHSTSFACFGQTRCFSARFYPIHAPLLLVLAKCGAFSTRVVPIHAPLLLVLAKCGAFSTRVVPIHAPLLLVLAKCGAFRPASPRTAYSRIALRPAAPGPLCPAASRSRSLSMVLRSETVRFFTE